MTHPDSALLVRNPLIGRLRVPAILVAIAVALGIFGPFGSYLGMSLPVRLLHFTITVMTISGVVALLSVLARRYVFGGPLPLWGVAAVAVAAAPVGASIVHWHLGLWALQVLPFVSWLDLLWQNVFLNLVIGGLVWAAQKRRATAAEAATPIAALEAAPSPVASPEVSGGTEVHQRLPLPLRQGRVLALCAEDHYLRVHTDRGQALILMSLSEAVTALGEEAGIRIHRSHWVARQALMLPRTDMGRTTLKLDGGITLPVSRSGRRLLVEAGLT
jgi:hypothetical protein